MDLFATAEERRKLQEELVRMKSRIDAASSVIDSHLPVVFQSRVMNRPSRHLTDIRKNTGAMRALRKRIKQVGVTTDTSSPDSLRFRRKPGL